MEEVTNNQANVPAHLAFLCNNEKHSDIVFIVGNNKEKGVLQIGGGSDSNLSAVFKRSLQQQGS